MTLRPDGPLHPRHRAIVAISLAIVATTWLGVGAASPAPGSQRASALQADSASSARMPPFVSSVAPVTTAQLGATWHSGCPVGAGQLRRVTVRYLAFDGRARLGTIVVNVAVASSVVRVFKLLYESAFPIKEIVPQSSYDGNDNAAAAADDTSGFNCRLAVASGPPRWSVHAYGEAIDVNDVQNPYIDGPTIIPPAGAAYRDRQDVRPGMAVLHGTLLDAFATIGWQWGGRWTATPDYQHFSLTGG